MAKTSNSDTVSALNDLLEDERDALLKGDLDRITSMLEPKETLIATLAELPDQEPDSIQMLNAKVRRNQLLLDGALEGIRAVTKRIAALHHTAGTLSTYGSDGSRKLIDSEGDGSVEKRA
jgi:flagellar biosynthesis/type III secretory pathway chaperone